MKKILFIVFASLAAVLSVSSCCSCDEYGYKIKDGVAVYNTPARPADQISMIGFAADPIETVRVAFIGLGDRGDGAVRRFTYLDGVEIVALCDIEEDRVNEMQELLAKRGKPAADAYFGSRDAWKELCQRDDIDLVYIVTDWKMHTPMAVYAMEHGKHVAIEVPATTSIEECWQLVNTAEKTQRHCMMLENCVYDFFELTTLNMAQHGLFGEVIHAEGAYIHDLRALNYLDPANKGYQGYWRLKWNNEHFGNPYPTHGLVPLMQAMNINRGDRFTTLVAMDTKSVNGKEYVERKTGKPCNNYRNGDHTTTLMRTAQGKVVEIQHNVMTPQPYNRLFKLTGTKGYATKYPTPEFALSGEALKGTDAPQMDNLNAHKFMDAKQKDALMKKYYHPILTEYGENGRSMGHGGMDYIMDARLVYCLQHGLPLDIDVYDMAEWCCLAELGALSMDNNCAAVSFPDFTRGHWNEVKGFKHAYAPAAEEAEVEAKAEAYTAAQKEAVAANNLWALYDAVRKAEGDKAKAKAEKAYRKAVAKADKQIETKLAAKK